MNWVIMPYIDCWQLTHRAVLDVLDQSIETEILLIDNGSSGVGRADADTLQALVSRVRVWHHQPPLPALGATWNMALRYVWEAGGEHALVVNNDVRLHEQLYAALLRTQQETGAWFVTACNIAPLEVDPAPILPWDDAFLSSRGGPDFSCYLITKECHRWFQFDEGFVPAYHEDNDYHRRLILAGMGERIFSVPVPYHHIGSATVNRSETVKAGWGEKFKASQDYYRQKWGGLPHHETTVVPFDLQLRDGDLGFADARVLMTGQGKPGNWGFGAKTLFKLPAEDQLG